MLYNKRNAFLVISARESLKVQNFMLERITLCYLLIGSSGLGDKRFAALEMYLMSCGANSMDLAYIEAKQQEFLFESGGRHET